MTAPTASPRPPRVLVVTKTTRYQQLILEQHDEHVASLIAAGDISVAQLERAHAAHERSLASVLATLAAHGLEHSSHTREELSDALIAACDLVVVVGGDGTVLDLSHRVTDTPVLAINSDPSTSVGYFCAGAADAFEGLLQRTLSGTWAPRQLARFSVSINDELHTSPVLNDILIAHTNPAAVSSYILRVDDHEEVQRSSGIWIATPAGSTAAIRSAGGYVLSLNSDMVQFLVREPYPPRKGSYRLVKGLRPASSTIEIISKMSHGAIYMDGPHISYPFQIGDRLRIHCDAPKLRLYGLDESHRT